MKTNNFSIAFFPSILGAKTLQKWTPNQFKVAQKSTRPPKGRPRCSQDVPRRTSEASKRLPQPLQDSSKPSKRLASQNLPKPAKSLHNASKRVTNLTFCSSNFTYAYCAIENNNMTFLTSPFDREYSPDTQKSKCTLETSLTYPMSTCC